jgi:succinate-semialdehyde dehydrogenase/glutarate-semialdehyde dehydrogenase
MTIESINPATGEIIKEYPEMTLDQVKEILAKSKSAFLQWQKTDFASRAKLMKKAAEVLRNNSKEYAKLMTLEMGKPIKQGISETEKCDWTCDFYEIVTTDAKKSFVTYQPLGVVLAIMPWNFPFWQVFRFAAPALMAGNVGVLKHASNVPGCALAIEDVFRQAGFPENVFHTLLIGSKQVDSVIENPDIAAVTLTGSTVAGKAVAKKSGEMIKKTVLELGGSDAYVILDDADLENAVNICVAARLVNSGQSCVAAKRFITVEPIAERFEELFVKKMQAAKMGDPMSEATEIGPQARVDLRDQLDRQVQDSIAKGAKCLLGGKVPEGKGAYYPPTVLTDVKKGMPAYDEELFGPVAAIIHVKDQEEAIKVANDSIYGLGAAVFTQDLKKGEDIAAKLVQAGSCFVNAQVHSDPRLPFGGIKESGYGRELSQFGIREFVNIKTVISSN